MQKQILQSGNCSDRNSECCGVHTVHDVVRTVPDSEQGTVWWGERNRVAHILWMMKGTVKTMEMYKQWIRKRRTVLWLNSEVQSTPTVNYRMYKTVNSEICELMSGQTICCVCSSESINKKNVVNKWKSAVYKHWTVKCETVKIGVYNRLCPVGFTLTEVNHE